ncbi:hypothetical protein EDD37DRAFT_61316 [Exophiala viscosa]|uniref:CAP-Gly domain-containing protein n=1 Tax=Exophiala viscosa TaxID=2486360 RepID=A0AAN6E2X0_9EURO|nr:hypothetical protein EDD36DRAFT_146615 [Exophiala viscosa]KAI1629643.1 hypothetical protein EDD37DRAFT_61316 [Exophiala viscosa]
MESDVAYVGQRRSYSGALCTVRYQGPLPSLKGEWLGVEWDDPTRGKHNGSHEDHQVFKCLSPVPTAASFVRPSRKPDPERTLLEGIKFKYAPSTTPKTVAQSASVGNEAIEISGKVVEEVGFDRIKKQLSLLADLKIVLVDELALTGIAARDASNTEVRHAQRELQQDCPNIVELDIGWNTIETWQAVADICLPLKKLRILKAGGLRLRGFTAKRSENEANPFQTVEELYLNECLFSPEQILQMLSPGEPCGFPSLKVLSLSLNELDVFGKSNQSSEVNCPSVTTLILDNNRFRDLSSLPDITSLLPNITSISLQSNEISQLGLETARRFGSLETLNLAGNRIDSYAFVDALPSLFPNLTSLRISRNPLHERSHNGSQQQQSAASDSTSYYLTLARLPGLKSLNYTTITPRDREEGEIYYLSVVEKEIRALLDTDANSSVEQKAKLACDMHPLYTTLCAKYDREDMVQVFVESMNKPASQSAGRPKTELDIYAPGTLGSRLVDACFYIPESESESTENGMFQRLLPTTVSVYRLKSLVARHFGLHALQFRLVYESHEYDPVEPISVTTRNTKGKEDWDAWGEWDVDSDHEGDQDQDQDLFGHSQDDDDETASKDGAPKYMVRDGQRFRKRETEILDGMREWGDFLDLTAHDGSKMRDVRVRVEPF